MAARSICLVFLGLVIGVAFDHIGSFTTVRAQSSRSTASSDDLPSMQIGSVTVRLGEERSAVLARFEKSYRIATPNEQHSLIWTEPVEIDGINHSELLATLDFASGRVSKVGRGWGYGEGPQVVKLWDALYGLITSKVGVDHRTPVSILVDASRNPQAQFDKIHLMIGRTDMTISRFRYHEAGQSLDSVHVEESIQ